MRGQTHEHAVAPRVPEQAERPDDGDKGHEDEQVLDCGLPALVAYSDERRASSEARILQVRTSQPAPSSPSVTRQSSTHPFPCSTHPQVPPNKSR